MRDNFSKYCVHSLCRYIVYIHHIIIVKIEEPYTSDFGSSASSESEAINFIATESFA